MKLRVRFSAVAGMMLLLVFLSACASQTSAPTPDPKASAPTPTTAPAPAATPPTPVSTATSVDAVMDSLYPAAKAEGALTWYSLMGQAEGEKVIQAFNKRFPGIKVNVVRKGGQAILQQFQQEKQNGINNADVVLIGGMAPILSEFIPKEYIIKYTPADASAFGDDLSVPAYAYPMWVSASSVCYNTKNLTQDDINMLKTYAGWTDPRWKGRIAIAAPTGGSTARNVLILWQRPEFGETWLKKIADLQPSLFLQTVPMAERVAAGEFDVGLNCSDTSAGRLWISGAPIGSVHQEFSIVTPFLLMVANKAPHPTAAKLWMEWILSEEGQVQVMQAGRGVSVHNRVKTPPVDATWFEWPKEFVSGDNAKTYKQVDADLPKAIDAFSRIFNWSR